MIENDNRGDFMPFETAFSTEANFEDITALEANQYFFDGILTDPSAFQCSEDCVYPLTCKSFKKKSTEWKKAPHFCPGKNHSSAIHTCGKESTSTSSNTDGEQDQGYSVEKIGNKISLNISLSSGFEELKIKKESPGETATGTSNTRTGRKSGTTIPVKKERPQVNSLVRLIYYYYSDLYPNDQYLFTTLDDKKYCLDDLFFDLDSSKKIPNEVKVFFGTAYIIERPTYYVIRMKSFSTLDNITSKPSILIRKELLTKKKNLRKKFERMSKQSSFQFFYLGKIIKKSEYLNFSFKYESKLLANLFLKD